MSRFDRFLPWTVGLAAVTALAAWFLLRAPARVALRVPGTDQTPGSQANVPTNNPVLTGRLTPGTATPATFPGAWPRFRGPDLDGISHESVPLSRDWKSAPPRALWSVDLGEGYAGGAILDGRVYVLDYDQTEREDALRCLSLADGGEIWRFSYANPLKRNHGFSRTFPAVTTNAIIAIGPKCHVVCLDPSNGRLRWTIDLVREHGAAVPEWYAGQCPLIDGDRVLLAPAGPDALLLAVDLLNGAVLWKSPNPRRWKMTHSSVMPVQFGDRRMYAYCASGGVTGVDARDGRILWDTPDWKISIATVPSPVDLGGGRVFLTGGYNAGSLLLQLRPDGERFVAETVSRLKPEVFGATQHSPVLHQGHLYGVRADGLFACLDLEGKVVWTSDPGDKFGLGSFLIADGLILALNDSGNLTLIEAQSSGYSKLGEARILPGPESWAPMSLVAGRLIARDLNKMVCLDLRRP